MSREAVEKKEDEDIGTTGPVSLKIPSRAEYILLARLVVSQVAELADFGQQDIYDLKLAITEAATNVIRHAEVDYFEIEYRAQPGVVEITVEDAGEGFEARDFTGDPDSQGGFGLSVIQNLVDDLALESTAGGGTRLRMTRRASASTHSETG